jgi:hypothetical protein
MREHERMLVGDLRPHFIATAGKISRPFRFSSNIIAKVDRGLIATEKGPPRLKSESKRKIIVDSDKDAANADHPPLASESGENR